MKTCKTCRKWYPISDTMGMCYARGAFMKLSIFDIMPGVVFDVEEEKLVMR